MTPPASGQAATGAVPEKSAAPGAGELIHIQGHTLMIVDEILIKTWDRKGKPFSYTAISVRGRKDKT